jgi:hypothetical protein
MPCNPINDEGRRGVPPLFSPRATTLFRVALWAAVCAVAASGSMAFAYYRSSYWNRIGVAQRQPILFSHRHHAGELRIDCRNCHSTVETAPLAGMPSTRACLACHSQIFAGTTMIAPLVASEAQGVPIEWVRVNRLPSHVYFNHSIHLAKGVACFTCHGDVGRQALVAKAQPLTMRWCLDCHRNPGPRLTARTSLFSPYSMRGKSEPGLMEAYGVNLGSLTNCSTCHH